LKQHKQDSKNTEFYSNSILKYKHKEKLNFEKEHYEEHRYARNLEFKDQLKNMSNNIVVNDIKAMKKKMKGDKK